VHEFDGRSRAFDIQKNNPDLRNFRGSHTGYFAAVCGGMYLGPQQTGS
jgi:hypothetical protein